MPRDTCVVDEIEAAVDHILARVGCHVVLGIPLGLGKPVELCNALYQRACREPNLRLTILTALSLAPPAPQNALERAFIEPFAARVFAGVPQLDYVAAQRRGTLPSNVEVCEFFFQTGAMLGNAQAQRDYISSNYTHAARDVVNRGCNVVAQMIARRDAPDGPRYSLSCNPDTGPEVIRLLQARGRPHLVVGLVNPALPFFAHDAERGAADFDLLIEAPRFDTPLFSVPNMPVSDADYAIGLHASTLVRDGGTLQLGIGSLGDAIAYALLLREQDNACYRQLIDDFRIGERHGALIDQIGGLAGFDQGLYAATEMFVGGLWQLLRAGILRRRVFDFWALQQAINEGRCDPQRLDAGVLDYFDEIGVRMLRTQDFEILQHHGFFTPAVRYEHGSIVAPDGRRAIANLADPQTRVFLAESCLGETLRNGIVLHGGFFLGPRALYQGLRELDEPDRNAICMTGVDKINQLDRNPRLYQLQRRHARFINTGMMVTLSGNVVSDGLDDGRVVSGVGGQYNFVAQAQQLDSGRSILLVRAVRDGADGKPVSNVLFNYGHTTIPRHLRDIVISEYGIADLRSKTNSEIAKALIGISDSRFQSSLLAQARKAGLIEASWQLPEHCRNNTPEAISKRLQPYRQARTTTAAPRFGLLPFGSDFDVEEEALLPVLARVRKRAATTSRPALLWQWLRFVEGTVVEAESRTLQRLQLLHPRGLQQRITRMLVLQSLRAAT